MSIYTLIKKENNYLLCPDKKIETLEDNKVLLIDGVLCRTELREGSVVSRQISGGATMDIGKTECVELLASLHKIEGVPTLTFDEVVAKEIGYVDIGKLSDTSSEKHEGSYYHYQGYLLGFNDGYLQAIEDNKKRKCTEADIERAVSFGFGQSTKNGFVSINEEAEFIKSIIPTQWQVEIEMKHFDDLDMITHVRMSSAKITNNSIKITKILSRGIVLQGWPKVESITLDVSKIENIIINSINKVYGSHIGYITKRLKEDLIKHAENKSNC